MVENEEVLPAAVLELVGMQQLQIFPPQLELFFLVTMVTNVIIMGLLIGHSVHRMRESYEKGAFAFYYIQMMRPWQIYLLTIARIVFSALLVWGIYVAGVLLAGEVLCSGLTSEVLTSVPWIIYKMGMRGIVIVVLMTAIGVLYGIKQNYKMHGVDYGICLMFLGFAISNAYKIPQLIGQKQVEEMVNAQEMMQLAYTMKQVRCVYPLAWLNPFNVYHEVLDVEMITTYGWIAIMIFVVAGVSYSARDWQEL